MRFGSYLVYIVYLDRYSLTHINFTIVTNELKRQAMYTNSQKKTSYDFVDFKFSTTKKRPNRTSFAFPLAVCVGLQPANTQQEEQQRKVIILLESTN